MIDVRIPPRPKATDPARHLIDELGRLRAESPLTTRQQARAGVSLATTHDWRHGTHQPTLGKFERALNVIGYRLAIVKADQ